MTEIGGDLDSFAVDPKHYAPLRRFSCGERGFRSEREVNKLAREYASGRHKGGVFRVTVDVRKALVGVAAFQATASSQPMLGRFPGSPYISVIGLSERFRGDETAGGRLSDFVLLDALQAINQSWGGAPDTFALVDPNNRRGRDLFERNGFRMITPAPANNHEADALFRRIGGRVRWRVPSETAASAGASKPGPP